VNEFGEDERPEIMPDACYELLRHIADDLLDTRKHVEATPEAWECDNISSRDRPPLLAGQGEALHPTPRSCL
jgi:hypothetical protein